MIRFSSYLFISIQLGSIRIQTDRQTDSSDIYLFMDRRLSSGEEVAEVSRGQGTMARVLFKMALPSTDVSKKELTTQNLKNQD